MFQTISKQFVYIKKTQVEKNSYRTRRLQIVSQTNTRRKILFCGSFCGCCTLPKKAKANSEWYYNEQKKPLIPSQWDGLCSTGTSQSPIDIQLDEVVDSEIDPSILEFNYRPVPATCLNTGHGNMQVNFNENSLYVMYGNRKLVLLQYHFHTPSEHGINQKRFDMEVHLVHRDVETNDLVVFASFIKASNNNFNPLQSLLLAQNNAPPPTDFGYETLMNSNVNPIDLIPPKGSRKYISYKGSLTTPPCTENVKWIIFGNAIKSSTYQVIDFRNYLSNTKQSTGTNNRPWQKLNGRFIHTHGSFNS